MADPTLQETWQLLRTEVESLDRQLSQQYEASLGQVQTLLAGLAERVRGQQITSPGAGGVAALVKGAGEGLLFEPIRALRKIRPQQRALEALESYQAGLDDLARRVPQQLVVSGAELVEVFGPYIRPRLWQYWLRRQQRVTLPLRRMVESQAVREAVQRERLDGSCFLLLAQGYLRVLTPWQDLRRQALRRWGGGGSHQDSGDAEQQWEKSRTRWLGDVSAGEAMAKQQLAAYQERTSTSAQRLAAAIVRGKEDEGRAEQKDVQRRQRDLQYWSRQQRAVSGLVDLEWESALLLSEVWQTATDALEAIDGEGSALVSELEAAIHWLQQSSQEGVGGTEGEFPPSVAPLLSAEDRMGAWERAVQERALIHLPSEMETIDPRREVPSRSPWGQEPWRQVEPQRTFLSAIAKLGRPIVRDGFREVESAHRAVIRVIEQAREVVQFSQETAEAEPEEASTVAREGLSNALSLASHHRQTMTDPRGQAERRLKEGIASTFALLHLSLEQHRLGLLTHMVRQQGMRAARESWKVALEQASVGGRWLHEGSRARYHWLLRKVGWEAEPIAMPAPIVARSYVGEVLNLQMGARELPMIYRRLFRLAPVEDPRFLVGREAEMAALAQARNLWHSSRSVAVMVVGGRGSGKTSLLNCAVAKEFAGVDVIRSQFGERITDAEQMTGFLHRLLEIPRDQDLREALAGCKRIVMLEELERTFLRRMNGFGGLRELLSVVSGSCRTTLWILCMNQHAHRYLQRAIGIDEYFTHQINAMAIPPEQLKNAILLRHNLSGLRLQFPAVPGDGERLHGVRRLLGLQKEAEDHFFEALYQQSEGIFRSSFELWQHFMERVEGGVLYLRQAVEPDYEPLLRQLNQTDLFTLHAILQHGSLTDRDHAEVFECAMGVSRFQLERLLNLECLEPDPAGPGYRIRPEATRLVHITLDRHNLV